MRARWSRTSPSFPSRLPPGRRSARHASGSRVFSWIRSRAARNCCCAAGSTRFSSVCVKDFLLGLGMGMRLASSSTTAPVASRGSRSRNARTVTSVFLPSLVSICAALQRLSIAAVSPSRSSGGHSSPDTNLANTRTWRQQAIEDPWLVQPRACAAKATANEPCMAAGTGSSAKSCSCLKPARRPDPRRWTPQRRGSTPAEGKRRALMVESCIGTVRMPAASGLPERPVHGIDGPAVG